MDRTCGINNSFDSREWQSVIKSRQLELGERSEPFLKNMKWSMNNSSYRCCSHQLRLVSCIVGSTIAFPRCVCLPCVLYAFCTCLYASVCVCICMPACVCVHYFLCWYCYWYYNVQIEQQQQGQLGLGLLLLFLLMFLLLIMQFSNNKADWLSVYSRQRIGLVTLFVL